MKKTSPTVVDEACFLSIERLIVTVRFERRFEPAENRSREIHLGRFSIRFLDRLESYSNQTVVAPIKPSPLLAW